MPDHPASALASPRAAASGIAIDIAVEHDAWGTLGDLDALVRRAVEAAVSHGQAMVADGAELSLVLCDDAFIRDLNKTWRGKDKATNVLSFPTEEPLLLGDIVVAYETTSREAEAEGKPLSDHLTHLVVHGVLHLLGFDHEADSEAEAMEGLEAHVLSTLGIASPYRHLDVDELELDELDLDENTDLDEKDPRASP